MVGRRFLDFHKKNYQNPFFKRSKSGFHYLKNSRGSKIKLWRKKIVLFFLLATIFGWIWFLFYSPYFKIEKIEILGLEKIDKNEIKAIVDWQISRPRFLIFRQENLFLFNKEDLSKNIKTKYIFDNLTIEKNSPNSLIIRLKEKASKIIWIANNKNYNVDLEGTAVSETSTSNSEIALPIVYDESNKEVVIGEKLLGKEQVQAVCELSEKISQIANVEIVFYKITTEKELRAVTKEGWYILFNGKDVESQLLKLNLILKEKIKDQRKNLEYIDLRFEDRVYYK